MLFVMIDEGRRYKLVPASKIEKVVIKEEKADWIEFSDGAIDSVSNFYESLVEIKGKEIESL